MGQNLGKKPISILPYPSPIFSYILHPLNPPTTPPTTASSVCPNNPTSILPLSPALQTDSRPCTPTALWRSSIFSFYCVQAPAVRTLMHSVARALLTPQWLVHRLLYLDKSAGENDERWCFCASMSADVAAQNAPKIFRSLAPDSTSSAGGCEIERSSAAVDQNERICTTRIWSRI